MLVSITPDIQKNLEDQPAFEILQELKTMFQQQAKQELFKTIKAFHSFKATKRPKGEKAKLAYDPKHRVPPSCKKVHPAKGHLSVPLLPQTKNLEEELSSIFGRVKEDIASAIWHIMGIRGISEVELRGALDLHISIGIREASKYLSQEFLDHLRIRGIISQLTPPYTPQHNGVLERRNQTLLDMVRSMMSLTTLPMSFWGYALESAARILNMVPTKKVNKTPYEMWHGKVPNLSYLKVWGCEALVKRDTPNKLESRSIKCIFVGYPKETMGYYFYYPLENKIFVARYAEFFETNLIKQEASGSTVDFDEIQNEDAQPSENTSLHQYEIEHDTVEPQIDVIPIRRSARIPQAPERYGFYIDDEEHELGDHGEPPNYRAALSNPESEKWLESMNSKMQSMKDNQVWNLVDLPPNCKTIRSKWLFKKKTDMDGNIHTYKARLVAKGFTQTYRVDYEETFSPVADIKAIRILIAIATYYD
ncbi:retrotransposon protein, putative, ty1-copia subclass [Tanacetum coccineum]